MVSLTVMMMTQSWEGIIPSCAIACSSHGAPEHKDILYGQLHHHDVMVVMTVSLIVMVMMMMLGGNCSILCYRLQQSRCS